MPKECFDCKYAGHKNRAMMWCYYKGEYDYYHFEKCKYKVHVGCGLCKKKALKNYLVCKGCIDAETEDQSRTRMLAEMYSGANL